MVLSERQQRILEFIEEYIAEKRFPPTIREIGSAVNISSTSVVNYNLKKLESAGYLERNPEVSRGLRLLKPERATPPAAVRPIKLRLGGRSAAGQPIPVPDQNPFGGETVELTELLSPDPENLYALEVRGDSMIDALVSDGDLVILRYQQTARNGEMVAAWLKNQEEATLKYFHLEGDRVRLQPANPSYQPIWVPANQVEVQGKVVAVIRRLN
jgi:repressor LexA